MTISPYTTQVKPQPVKLIHCIMQKDETHIIEIRNFDDIEGAHFIESLSEFGKFMESPVNVQMDKQIDFYERMAEKVPEHKKAFKSKIKEIRSTLNQAGFTRYMYAIKQIYDAQEVINYIESYKAVELQEQRFQEYQREMKERSGD